MGRAADARDPRADAEAVAFHRRAVHQALVMGAPTSAPYDAHDAAGDALVRWLATGRRGGVSYRSARYRVLDALREHRHSRRVGQLVRVHPRPVAGRDLAEDDQSEFADPLDRPAPEPTPEAWAEAHEAAERADAGPPAPLAVLREILCSEPEWTPAVEARVAAVLERVAAEAAANARRAVPLRDRIEAWLAEHPGDHPQTEIARALGVRRESVCRAMRG